MIRRKKKLPEDAETTLDVEQSKIIQNIKELLEEVPSNEALITEMILANLSSEEEYVPDEDSFNETDFSD